MELKLIMHKLSFEFLTDSVVFVKLDVEIKIGTIIYFHFKNCI